MRKAKVLCRQWLISSRFSRIEKSHESYFILDDGENDNRFDKIIFREDNERIFKL